MNILIADLSNPNSLGNLLTLDYVNKMIKKHFPKATLRAHTSHPENKDLNTTRYWNESLSSLFLSTKKFSKFKSILNDYVKSDLVIFIGNANFKTLDNSKDLIRLLVHLVAIVLAKKTSGKVLIMPTSFGPFRSEFHRNIALKGVGIADCILARDERSYKLLKGHLGKKAVYVKDLILLSAPNKRILTTGNKLTVGITFKNWNDVTGSDFEKDLAETLATLQKDQNIRIIPILIDNLKDKKVPETISYDKFKNNALINGLKIEKPATYKSAKEIHSLVNRLDFLVSLRTNSTLLAVSQALPFVTFSKHEKVETLLNDLKLHKYYKETGFLSSPKSRKVFVNLIMKRVKQTVELKKIRGKLQSDNDIFVNEFISFIN